MLFIIDCVCSLALNNELLTYRENIIIFLKYIYLLDLEKHLMAQIYLFQRVKIISTEYTGKFVSTCLCFLLQSLFKKQFMKFTSCLFNFTGYFFTVILINVIRYKSTILNISN